MLVRCSSLQFFHQKRTFIFALPCRKQQLALRCRSRGYCERMDTCVRGCHVFLGCQWAGFVRAWNCWEAQASFQGVGQSLDDPMHCYLKDIQFQMFSLTKVFPSRFSTFLSTNHQLFKNNFCLHNFPRECQINQDGLQHGHGCTFLSQPHLELQRKWAPEPELSPACLEIQQDHGAACSWRSSFGIGFDWGSSPGNCWWVSPKSRAECKASPWRGEVQVRAEHDHWHLPWPLLLELVPINFARLIFWELIFWELILYCCSFFWFIIYTTIKDARAVLQRHIDHVKWKDCAFSTEQLKGQRWMLGSTPKIALPISRRHWQSARWHRSYTSSWWFTATRRMGAVWDNLPNPEYAGVVLNLMLIVILHASTVQLLRKLESWATGTLRRKLLWSRLSSRSFLVLFLNLFCWPVFFCFFLQSFAVSWINFYSIPTFFTSVMWVIVWGTMVKRWRPLWQQNFQLGRFSTWDCGRISLSPKRLMDLWFQQVSWWSLKMKLRQQSSEKCAQSFPRTSQLCAATTAQRRSAPVVPMWWKSCTRKARWRQAKSFWSNMFRKLCFFKIIFGIFVFSCAIKTYQNLFLFL